MDTNEKIDRLIALGKKRYIIRYGVLGWGLTTATLFTIVMYFMKGGFQVIDVVLPFVLFPLGGIGWGWFMWAMLSKQRRR